jgi:LDH2 family malate/lactate/ureidoglycolate dehydrogenase
MTVRTQQAIHAEALRAFATSILERVGLPRAQATDAADVLVWTSLRGIDTHGIRNFKRPYVDWLVDGRIKARPEFHMEYETPISARLNGDAGLGMAAACWGMRLAIRKATEMGVGLVSMRNSQHLGAAGYYAHLATRHDLIGVCTTGYLFAHGNDTGVLPIFGMRPMLSTNPLSIAFPCGEEPPFVLDMATSVVPVNRIEVIKDRGGTIPLGWGVDANGQPTTDPRALRSLLPLGGTRELGGHKGYGLGLVVEVLSALLSGAWRAKVPADRQEEDKIGYAQESEAHFFGAVRIDLFRPLTEFKQAMDAMIRALHAAPAAPGKQRIYVPGEIEHVTEQQRRRDGIPLPDQTAADLRALAEMYDVALELNSQREHDTSASGDAS